MGGREVDNQPKLFFSRLPVRRASTGRRTNQRRGYLFLAVLFTSAAIFALTTAALSVATSDARRTNDQTDRLAVDLLAESQFNRFMIRTGEESDWTDRLTNDAWTDWQTDPWVQQIGGPAAKVRYKVSSGTEPLDEPSLDAFDVTVEAHVLGAKQSMAMTCDRSDRPLECLEATVVANEIVFNGTSHLQSEGIVQANEIVTQAGFPKKLSASQILATTISTSSSYQTFGPLGTPKNYILPDEPHAAFESATVIPAAALIGAGGLEMQNGLLSHQNNPYGATNPDGLYLIDADGDDVIVAGMRIAATLIIRNAGVVQIDDQTRWSGPQTDPDTVHFTANLVTDGDIEMTVTEDMSPTQPWLDGILYCEGEICIRMLQSSPQTRLLRGAILCDTLSVHHDGNASGHGSDSLTIQVMEPTRREAIPAPFTRRHRLIPRPQTLRYLPSEG